MRGILNGLGIALVIIILIIAWGPEVNKVTAQTVPPPNVSVVKPAIPRWVRHKSFTSMEKADEYIEACTKEGFVVTIVATNSIASAIYDNTLVYAVKY